MCARAPGPLSLAALFHVYMCTRLRPWRAHNQRIAFNLQVYDSPPWPLLPHCKIHFSEKVAWEAGKSALAEKLNLHWVEGLNVCSCMSVPQCSDTLSPFSAACFSAPAPLHSPDLPSMSHVTDSMEGWGHTLTGKPNVSHTVLQQNAVTRSAPS